MARHKVTDVFGPETEHKTRMQIAQDSLGWIEWIDDSEGFCQCPGEHLHTTPTERKDCKVYIREGQAPNVHCVHASCEDARKEFNRQFQSAIGKMENSGKSLSDAIPVFRAKQPEKHDWSADLKPIELKTAWIHSHALSDCEDVPELQREMWNHHLSLFADDDNIWVGNIYDSAKIARVDVWKKLLTPPGNFVSHSTFTPEADGRKNEYIESIKYLVVESDTLTKTEQRSIFAWLQSHCGWSLRLVIDTAGKSLHGWFDWPKKLNIDQLKALLPVLKCDVRMLGASQPSRVAGAKRDGKLQYIVWTGPQTDNEKSWEEIIAVPVESLTDDNGREFPIDELLHFDTSTDPNNLLGSRWICRRGSLMIVGEAGIGKSSLVIQSAVCWSLGRPFFGIRPSRALRILIIQRENDEGDMAEEIQGVFDGLGINQSDRKHLGHYLKIIQNDTLTGMSWAKWLQVKVMQHQADLVFVDPLLSFADGEISKQSDATRFCRRELQPVLNATGCALVAAHHTGKPKSDKEKSSSLGAGSYAGLGSSEFTNWFRAVMLLQKTGDNLFTLSAEKRGKRAGMTKMSGDKTTAIRLRHASHGICWEQIDDSSFETPEGAVVRLGNASKVNADGYSQKGQEYRNAGVSRMPELRHDPKQPQFSEVIPWLMETLDLDKYDAAKEWEKIRSIGKNPTSKCKRIVAFSGKGKWKGCEE
jgi:uncharacterized protein YecT (DUF1311 family)